MHSVRALPSCTTLINILNSAVAIGARMRPFMLLSDGPPRNGAAELKLSDIRFVTVGRHSSSGSTMT